MNEESLRDSGWRGGLNGIHEQPQRDRHMTMVRKIERKPL
jgi:hypothetical protein